ncbi:endonuclease VII domain-containing protein [Micromonospora sp. NPDC049751]|uniref:endonuclease VII domain-containing protein n=1 Tax=Micromonospora sp. NPDC049751 TaxID=3154837 RepID=UPI0033E91A53
MKLCHKCERRKPIESFYKRSASKDGRQSYCIECAKERDKIRERPNTPERQDAYLQRTYGLSLADVEEMKAAQGGLCAICGHVPDRWVIDHCHDTGKVRGALCNNCNRCLGLLKDDADVLLSAAMYLLRQRDVLALEVPRGS